MATFSGLRTGTGGNPNPNKSFEVNAPPGDSVSSLSFSPKGNYLVSTSWDNQVRCWEVSAGSSVPKASISHDQPVLCSSWKDDGTIVFFGGCDKQVKMWPLISGAQPATVAAHDAPVNEIEWIPQMNLLVTGSWDKTLRKQRHDTYLKKLRFIKWKSGDSWRELVFVPVKTETMGICTHLKIHEELEINTWGVAKKSQIRKLTMSGMEVSFLCKYNGIFVNVDTSKEDYAGGICKFVLVHRDLSRLQFKKTLRYWDTRQAQPVHTQQLPERCYAMTVHYPLMVVGTADRNLIVYNLQNPQTEFKRIMSPLKYQTRCVAAFPDQQGFLVGSIEGRVGVHHLDDAQQSKNFTFKCHREGNEIYSVNSLNFHPVHHTFATAGSDGAFNFWDKDSKQRLKAMARCSYPIPCSAFNSDGSLFAYAVCYDWSKGAENQNPAAAKTYIFLHTPQESEVKGKPRLATSSKR